MYEYQNFKQTQMTFNVLFGAFAAYKFNPIQREASAAIPLFRKSWMKVPIRLGVFKIGFYTAAQLQTRFFPKFSRKHYLNDKNPGVSPQTYLANHDLISKFRFFDDEPASADYSTSQAEE